MANIVNTVYCYLQVTGRSEVVGAVYQYPQWICITAVKILSEGTMVVALPSEQFDLNLPRIVTCSVKHNDHIRTQIDNGTNRLPQHIIRENEFG